MNTSMKFALASAGLLFLMPLLAGGLRTSLVWLIAIYAVFIANAFIGAKRTGRDATLSGLQMILITQGIMIVVFYFIGTLLNRIILGGDEVTLGVVHYMLFAVIAAGAIGAGLVASGKPAEAPANTDGPPEA